MGMSNLFYADGCTRQMLGTQEPNCAREQAQRASIALQRLLLAREGAFTGGHYPAAPPPNP